MDHMNKEHAVFEQLTLRDFKKWNTLALNKFNSQTLIKMKKGENIIIP